VSVVVVAAKHKQFVLVSGHVGGTEGVLATARVRRVSVCMCVCVCARVGLI
jgi:hypothetical protein